MLLLDDHRIVAFVKTLFITKEFNFFANVRKLVQKEFFSYESFFK